MSKSPTAALNEVLLRAALRAERINQDRALDAEANALAKRNDNYASEYRHHRVPHTKKPGARDGHNRRQQPA